MYIYVSVQEGLSPVLLVIGSAGLRDHIGAIRTEVGETKDASGRHRLGQVLDPKWIDLTSQCSMLFGNIILIYSPQGMIHV